MDEVISPNGMNSPEPVQPNPNMFEQEWLDVEQSVAHALEIGLSRTPKTIRKWAERSSGLPDGDVVARREDTPWGYRWLIEKASLTRKVEEELELRRTNQSEPVRPAAPVTNGATVVDSMEKMYEPGADLANLGHTSSHASAPEHVETSPINQPEPGSHPFVPVPTGAEVETVLEEVRERLADKDKEIAFLRDQLAEAQAEVGRRAASTDEAVRSLDRVVRSFELQAEANRSRALGVEQRPEEARETAHPIQITPETIDNVSRHQDIRRV